VPEWHARYASDLTEALRAELVPVPGIASALDDLGVPSCVASSGTHEKMRLTLGLTGLHDRFAGRIFSATEVASGKPAPDLFLHAATRMGVEPARCVVVEDSAAGVQAARAAGMRALGYAGGLTPADWLEGPGTVVFDDMRALVPLIGSLAGGAGPSTGDAGRTGGRLQDLHRGRDSRKPAPVAWLRHVTPVLALSQR
jgi:HAD superfamily hydrolase (TIGR01509 family)